MVAKVAKESQPVYDEPEGTVLSGTIRLSATNRNTGHKHVQEGAARINVRTSIVRRGDRQSEDSKVPKSLLNLIKRHIFFLHD